MTAIPNIGKISTVSFDVIEQLIQQARLDGERNGYLKGYHDGHIIGHGEGMRDEARLARLNKCSACATPGNQRKLTSAEEIELFG